MIEQLITSRARVKVLARLLLHPDEEYYGAQLERLLDLQPRSVHRELKLLEKAGVLASRRVGRTIVYRADRECPIFPELHGMLLKTVGLGEALGQCFAGARGIKWAFIYGSAANGAETAGSDVDLMIIGSVESETAEQSLGDRLEEMLNEAEQRIGRPINHAVFSEEEIREMVAGKNAFVTGVLGGPKLMLVGDENELRGLAG